MFNLSIQNLLGQASAGAAARSTRSDGGHNQRDAAQAFNEVMQKHTARASERSPERTPDKPRESSAERSPDHSNEAPAARQFENASSTPASSAPAPSTSARGDTPEQRATDSATNRNAAPTKRAAGSAQAQTKDAATQDSTGPDTATGDLFADLNLALSKAAAPSGEDTAASKATAAAPAAADPAAASTVTPPGQPNGATAALIAPSTTAANVTAHAEDNASRDTQNAALVIDAAAANGGSHGNGNSNSNGDGNSKSGNVAKKAADPSAVGAAHDKAADKAAAMEPLAALAESAHTNTNTAARSEGSPLSLSAALAHPPLHAANALATSLAPTTTFSIGHAQVKTGVGAYGFAEDFSQRVVMLANQRVQSAEIALTPSDLGPVSVSLEMRGQEASLVFGAAQTATRAAIEDALPRLREMFQAQGLHLVDAQVSTQLSQHGQREAYAQNPGQSQSQAGGHSHQGRSNAAAGLAGIGAASDVSSSTRVMAQSNRLIDVHV